MLNFRIIKSDMRSLFGRGGDRWPTKDTDSDERFSGQEDEQNCQCQRIHRALGHFVVSSADEKRVGDSTFSPEERR